MRKTQSAFDRNGGCSQVTQQSVKVALGTLWDLKLKTMHAHENVVHDDANSREIAESGNGHNWRHRRGKERLRPQPTQHTKLVISEKHVHMV